MSDSVGEEVISSAIGWDVEAQSQESITTPDHPQPLEATMSDSVENNSVAVEAQTHESLEIEIGAGAVAVAVAVANPSFSITTPPDCGRRLVALPSEITVADEDGTSSTDYSAAASDKSVEVNIQKRKIADIVRNRDLHGLGSFSGGIQGVAEALNSDLENGISSAPARQIILVNILLRSFLKASNSETIFLLSTAAILSFVFGVIEDGMHGFGWLNGAVLISSVFLIIIVTGTHNFWKEWITSNLRVLTVVVRDGGNYQVIGETDVVVGDIVILRKGDRVPGDGLFVNSTSAAAGDDAQPLELNDGSSAVDENNPFLFYGFVVVNGSAKMLVTATREDTEMMSQSDEETNCKLLESSIHNLYKHVIIWCLRMSILIIIVLFLRYRAGKMDDERKYRPDPKGEPARVITITDAIMGIVGGKKGTTLVLTTLLSVTFLGLTDGVPVVISFATIFWARKMLADHEATASDNLACLKMASVTTLIICAEIIYCPPEEVIKIEDTKEESFSAMMEGGGVRTIIASGDDISVLEPIARNCGLVAAPAASEEDHLAVITGQKFRNWSDEERMKNLNNIRDIGNCIPSDKILLVKCLRKKGEVVALLAQRTTDALALKQADIGITFGTRSSQVARESSDITIWGGSDPFGFVVDAMIKSGRCFHDNIRKFIQLHLIFTISSTLINFIAVVSSGDAPITPVQLFWLNLVVSLFGGLALLAGPTMKISSTTVPAAAKLIITKAMWRNIAIQAIYQTTIFVTLHLTGQQIYNGFFLCQLFNLLIAREPEKKNIFGGAFRSNNFWFWVAFVIFVTCQGVFAVAEIHILGGGLMNFKWWGACLLIGLFSFPLDWAGKCASAFYCSLVSETGIWSSHDSIQSSANQPPTSNVLNSSALPV